MQNKLSEGNLLNGKGHLCEAGYSTSLVKTYNRKAIKGGKLRIKEWDYYLIYNDKVGLALTIADNSYMSLVSASVLDFKSPTQSTVSVMKPFTLGKLNLPSTSVKGDIHYSDKRLKMNFYNDGKTRRLICNCKDYADGKDFKCNLVIKDVPKDSMVIATPFAKKKTAFYYNQKINNMSVSGSFSLGDKVYTFNEKDSTATLDWGRGVWTYSNTWYWSSMSVFLDNGDKFGFNLGYGFGDISAASENMVFYNGVAHKLDQVTFNIPKDEKGNDDFMKPWTFSSNDDRVKMDFVPIIDRFANTSAVIISSNQHQVFGKFSGIIKLDDGKLVVFKDKLGFAEKVKNKW